ncbi:hypothetical protein LTR36_002486 [Oleoguttula mirabilis]|uniref:Peptidase S59 domain-containing protein n=1 Tax=Oleoguttula mirabilis TaxID=1507867 RepID=A0AAV9JL27_9PEZI|nr:hypothetical protein LTR36_002486 [Oleoguttula mirabilis]
MSFGFGNGNNNSTFGGFGASNTSGTGFGANTNTTSAGGSLFGGNTATAGGAFGGFGANNANPSTSNSPFGANKPAFGAPAATTTSGGSGLFGNTTSTSGAFGGGSGTGFGNTGNASTGFGNNASGGLFGQQNKPAAGAFGASNTGTSLFGGGSGNASTGFGANTNTTASNPFAAGASNTGFGASTTNASTGGAFGASNTGGGAFGGFGGANTAAAGNNNQGTAATPFQAVQEKEGATNVTQAYQSVTFQEPYKNKSFEELRVEDYAQGRRFGNTNGQAGSFGQSTGFGGFGQPNTSAAGGGLFGSQQNQQNTATSGSTFGGFGNTAAPAAAAANPFSSNTTGGGLFGNQNKPAAGGLFGNTASTAATTGAFGSTAGSGGGLFGNQNNQQASNPFGGAPATNTGGGLFGNQQNAQQPSTGFGAGNTGGGLFGGQNNQQQQNKPAFGGFGQPANTGGAFGGSTSTGGGLFGGQNNQQQPSNPFGGSTANTGGGLFGAQPKPASGGLFGNTTTNTNTGGGLFGNNQNQSNTGGGLFGNQNQPKPAGTGLFGSNTTTGNTGGGIFGGTNNQQNNSGSSLFGGNNTGSSLFGNNQNKPAGSSLFGNNNTTNTGSSLFGGGNQQNQNQNTGNSLFGGGQQNQQNAGSSLFGSMNQQQQQPNQLHASLTGAPYGNEQLFSSLAAPSPPVGPLATPLNGARPQQKKTPSLMASMRLNTPVYTPRATGRTGGYGFSYSTYGTPTSAYSGSLTPGASSMLRPTGSFGSALTNRLNKSISMGNLRGDGMAGEGRPSLLRESALSPPGSAAGRYGSGSVRKLNIDRSLRTDLFAPSRAEESARNRVSFDRTAEQPQEMRRERESQPQPQEDNALVRTEEESEPEQSPGLLRAAPQSNGGARQQPEMAQINGTRGPLSSVPEDGIAQRPGSAPATQQRPASWKAVHGQEPPPRELGEYWTRPPIRDLKNMSRQQLQKLGKFVVGREHAGHIDFGSVDLSNVPLDDICGKIVRLESRNATVYADGSDKPPVGKGLNMPSTISLEQSWPREKRTKKALCLKEGNELKKHIGRLQKMVDTKFLGYDVDTGVWHFTVPHFTTYGLDDSDDEDAEGFTEQEQEQGESSGLSEAPETPGQQDEETMQSIETGTGEVDDTFEFKINRRSQASVPGGFEAQGVSYDYDDASADGEVEEEQHEHGGETEIEEMYMMSGAVQPPSPGTVERYRSSMMEEDELAGDFVADAEAEEEQVSPEMPGSFAPPEPKMPRSILKPSTYGLSAFASPEKLATDSWEEQLQRTISPRKRDRQALRDVQQSAMKAREQGDVIESPFKQSLFGQSAMGQSAFGQSYLATKSAKKAKTLAVGNEELGKSQAFRTSMDIMNSLWATEKTAGKKAGAGGKGFEYPYPKKARLSTSDDLSEQDAAFHDCLKPSFAADGTLVYAASGSAAQTAGLLAPSMQALVGEHKDVRFARFDVPVKELVTATLAAQQSVTTIEKEEGAMPHAAPRATTGRDTAFYGFVEIMEGSLSADPSDLEKQEVSIWQLCSMLFDPVGISCEVYKVQVPKESEDAYYEKYASRLKLDAFATFWSKLVGPAVDAGLRRTKTAEEKALLLLTKNDIAGACDTLIAARDFRLATLVAQQPGSQTTREMMKRQIAAWRKRKDWSEMSDAVRALYCILAGELCVVPGQLGAAEDSVAEFCISDKFGLSWQQSFALRVYFGGHATLEDAITAYCEDLDAEDREPHPTPFWVDSMDHPNYEDEDTVLALLRLSAGAVEPTELYSPLVVSGNIINSRLAWQLASTLGAREIAPLPEDRMANLTLEYAAELETAGELFESAWVLLHLKASAIRQQAVTGLLQRNAGKITDPSAEDGNFGPLVDDLQIPRSMVFAAKALYAKAMDDPNAQARWLLQAGHGEEAHEVLCTTVGPQAVIEQDYESLSDLVHEFPRRKPAGWEQGGHVYESFVQLVSMTSARRNGSDGEKVLRSLQRGLVGMDDEEDGKTLEHRVAVIEMKRYAEEVAREQGGGAEEQGTDAMMMDESNYGVGLGMLEKYRLALGEVA